MTTRQEPLLRASSLTKRYPSAARPALLGCDLTLRPGELVAVIGRNGAGKSTLFDALAGFTRPTAGRVECSVPAQDIGWCPQREILDWSLTVTQNIMMALDLQKKVDKQVKKNTFDHLTAAFQLTNFLTTPVENLSGGELHRTQIVRALIGNPTLMILDEPTTGLDPSGTQMIFTQIRRRVEAGAAALISTHETSRFATWCTRVIAIKDGQVIADESTSTFMTNVNGDDLWEAYEALEAAL